MAIIFVRIRMDVICVWGGPNTLAYHLKVGAWGLITKITNLGLIIDSTGRNIGMMSDHSIAMLMYLVYPIRLGLIIMRSNNYVDCH